jgi:hypothetical protein
MIVKVQRPLFPPGDPWLVYDRARTFMIMLSTDFPDMGEDVKAYFRAEYTNGQLKLFERVPDEPW